MNNNSIINTTDRKYKISQFKTFIKKVLSTLEKILPHFLYDRLYTIAFSCYRTFLRILFLRFWFWFVLTGNTRSRKRTEFIFRVMPYSLVGWRGLAVTYNAVLQVIEKGIDGAIVECGVARGGSAALMGLASQQAAQPLMLWLFDSYEGLPEPTENDFDSGGHATGLHIRPLPKGSCLGTYEDVERVLFDTMKLNRDTIVMVKGWFENTLPIHRNRIGSIAILRLDGDWYESTKCCLENLYCQVTPEGIIIIDDYYSCFGAKKATDEFLTSEGLNLEMISDGRGGCYFIKPY